jgi:hypothetical protein
MGTTFMICTSMLLAAHIGNGQKIWEQFEKMNPGYSRRNKIYQ